MARRGFLGHGSTLVIDGRTIGRVEDVPNLDMGAADEVEVTGYDSPDGFREYIPGLKDTESIEAVVMMADDSADDIQHLLNLYNAGTVVACSFTAATGGIVSEFQGYIENHSFSFPIGDKITDTITIKLAGKPAISVSPLYVTASTPADGSSDVALNTEIEVAFNSDITAVTDLSGLTVSGVVEGSVALTAPSIDGNILKFDNANLTENEDIYSVTIPAGTVKDDYDNENRAYILTFQSVRSFV